MADQPKKPTDNQTTPNHGDSANPMRDLPENDVDQKDADRVKGGAAAKKIGRRED